MDSLWLPYQAASSDAPPAFPLSRYLPPVPEGMIAAWLQKNVPAGSIILDPFGSSPQVALEAAQAGYRVVVTCNNPIIHLMIELLAAAPTSADFLAVLSDLAVQKRGDVRLETFLSSIYNTTCPGCEQIASASAFLWHKAETTPYAKRVTCPACQWDGESPITEKDVQLLEKFKNDTVSRTRALQRVNFGDEEAREGASEAIDTYLPQQLNFLFTLLNKIQTMDISPERKNILLLMFIMLCDEGNMMWGHPPTHSHPKQISIPTDFVQKNLWQTLEEIAAKWENTLTPVPVYTYQQDIQPEPGITLFAGRLRELLPLKSNFIPQAVLTIFPRPNQAFWTFSALWSGWIWGPEAVLPLKGSLQRKRYGWQWHANALLTAFHSLQKYLKLNIPFYGIVAEANPGFVSAILSASENSGLALQGFSWQEEEEIAQLHWKTAAPPEPTTEKPDMVVAMQEGIRTCLRGRAEPTGYSLLFSAGLLQLVKEGCFAKGQPELPYNELTLLQNQFGQVFSKRHFLRRFDSDSQSPEAGLWWLEDIPADIHESLADRVERFIRSSLQQNMRLSLHHILEQVYANFPGLLTPPKELVEMCLQSYAHPNSESPQEWWIIPDEMPEPRAASVNKIMTLLQKCAAELHLNYTSEPAESLVLNWLDDKGNLVYRFFIQSHACISSTVLRNAPLAEKGFLILPGSRSNLLAYKIQQNPFLAERVAAGWHFLKFRHLRAISARSDLTLENWTELLDADPPRWEQPQQLSIFHN